MRFRTMEPNDLNKRLERIEETQNEIKSALLGSMGMPGLVNLVQDHSEWIKNAEKERNVQKGVTMTVGALAGALAGVLVKMFTGQS